MLGATATRVAAPLNDGSGRLLLLGLRRGGRGGMTLCGLFALTVTGLFALTLTFFMAGGLRGSDFRRGGAGTRLLGSGIDVDGVKVEGK